MFLARCSPSLPVAAGAATSLRTSAVGSATSMPTFGTSKRTPSRLSSAHTGAFEERICFDRLVSSEMACSGLSGEP